MSDLASPDVEACTPIAVVEMPANTAAEGSWDEGSIWTADSDGRMRIEWPGRFDRAMEGSERVFMTLFDQGPAAMTSES